MIAAAAYQYGMSRVLAMLEGKTDVWDGPENGAPAEENPDAGS